MRLIHGLKLILGDSWWMTHSWFSNRPHNNGALSKLRIHSTLEDSDPTEGSDTFSWNLKWNLCFSKSDLISVFNKPTTFQSNLATLTWSPHDSLPWSLPVKSQSSVSRHFWLKKSHFQNSFTRNVTCSQNLSGGGGLCKVATRSSARVASRTLTVLSSSAPCAPPACHTSTTPLHRHSGQDFEPLGWADKVKSLKVLHHPAFVRLLHFRILATF